MEAIGQIFGVIMVIIAMIALGCIVLPPVGLFLSLVYIAFTWKEDDFTSDEDDYLPSPQPGSRPATFPQKEIRPDQ